jgi:aldose 1-epimerase
MTLKKAPYGRLPDGTAIDKFIIADGKGLTAELITYGGILTALTMPDRRGKTANINLGFDRLEDYVSRNPFFGALVGRFANRIARGAFFLDGRRYQLSCNNPSGSGANAVAHHLHGGNKGFDKVVWKAKPIREKSSAGVVLSYVSKDGEENYPGTLRVEVTYRLTEDNELSFEYTARTSKPTPINLSQHSYWNLAGAGSILDHELQMSCPFYLPVDATIIPTGEVLIVKGTPMDFTTAKTVGRDIGKVAGGYDHCLVAGDSGRSPLAARSFRHVATLYEPAGGRGMEVWTTKPGVQLYTGNFLNGIAGAGGAVYNKHYGLCLETEFFPDSVNRPHFPSCILRPGETYAHKTVHRFFVK